MTKLNIEIESSSYLLKDHMQIEVRDSQFRNIKSFYGGREIDIKPGVYEVSAVLEDGKQHKQFVNVIENNINKVVLSARNSISSNTTPEESVFMNKDINIPKIKQLTIDSKLISAFIQTPNSPRIESLHNVKLYSNNESDIESKWWFVPSDSNNHNIDSIPHVDFSTPSHSYSLALPVNPLGYFPENACLVEFKWHHNRWMPRVKIVPERTVASALQNMLESGQILRAADVANEATELLRGKYSDPTGAVLGALILNKVGLLEDRIDWLKNLSRDFPWLPDGSILLASILSRNVDTEEDALNLLLSVMDKPVLFTESYSILVNLLRRWPSEKNQDSRNKALSQFATGLADIDWSLSTLSISKEISTIKIGGTPTQSQTGQQYGSAG